MPAWSFVLSDTSGSALAELATASGRSLTFVRNGVPEVRLTISHEDEAAGLLLDAVQSGTPLLRAYRNGVLRFHGYLAPFSEELDEATQLSLVFRGPFGKLLGDGQNRGRFSDSIRRFSGEDAGQIAKTLIDETPAPTIATDGAIEPTKIRDRAYKYGNIGEAIVGLTSVLDGFDFEVTPIEYSAGDIGQFNVYATQGIPQPAALFQYGPETLANVRSVTRQLQPPVNAVRVLGANGLTGLASDAASIVKHGQWVVQVSETNVSEQLTLTDKANALLRPEWIKVVRFSPEPTLAPRPWDDYWLGDTVSFYGRRGAFEEDVQVRIHKIAVVIDDEGNEAYEIEDPGLEGATLTTQVEGEVVD